MTILIGQITPDELVKYNISEYVEVNKICHLNRNIEYELYVVNTYINEFGFVLICVQIENNNAKQNN